MIYTVTLNPSLDYTANALSLNKNSTNRTNDEYIVPGGKGLNVSVMLSRFNMPTVAFGIVAGFTGAELVRLVENYGIKCDFIKLENGFTRINVKLVTDGVTEFNGSGITFNEEIYNKLISKIKMLKSDDVLVLSGSAPKGADNNIYANIAKCVPQNVKVVVDACGDLLLNTLKYKPFLIKPNKDELCEIFNKQLTTKEEIIEHGKMLQQKGAQNVLISLGKEGAVLIDSTRKIYYSAVPKGTPVNTVGAGDSMVAGFITKYLNTGDSQEALRFAVACGSATSYCAHLAQKQDVERLYKSL